MSNSLNDTICALATRPGGAIAVIRVSGNESLAIVDKVFQKANGKLLAEAAPNTIHYGQLTDSEGNAIDEVMASVFKAPHSYTGEDSVEAYLNGKMDLSQAEAVADLIASSNKATHQMALSQLRGHFSNELSTLREQLLHITTLMELELDFSDHEELEFADRGELLALATQIDGRIMWLARTFATGKAIKQGIPVAIVGKTNVGKSTLLNKLLHEEKAIVSDIHGTTRDVIEDTTQIHGLTFRFIDTAGIRHTDDHVERLGIERTYQKLHEATIVVWVTDESPTDEELRDMRQRCEGKRLLMVRNKIDLCGEMCPKGYLPLCAKQGKGLQELEDALYQAADIPEITENDVIITSVRHYEALIRAHEAISLVIQGMENGLSSDLLSEHLRVCLDALADITGGSITPQEVLNNVFKHFCIGK